MIITEINNTEYSNNNSFFISLFFVLTYYHACQPPVSLIKRTYFEPKNLLN